MNRLLQIRLLDLWHCGSGRGQGLGADATVVRSPEGLPYVPGRTLKGLLREAVRNAEELGQVDQGTARAWFGSSLPASGGGDTSQATLQEIHRYDTQAGILRVGSAELGRTSTEQERFRAWAAAEASTEPLSQLFRCISATALEGGLAKKRSLRTFEFAVPMTLYAPIEALGQCAWSELARSLPLLRSLGVGRSRGFGRCTASLVGEDIA